MSTLIPLALAILSIFLLNALKAKIIQLIEGTVRKFTNLSDEFNGSIFPAIIRTVRLNWYIFLLVALLFGILFFVPVGNDIIEAWLNKYEDLGYLYQFSSLMFLFLSTFLMSLSMWLIPFFLLSKERSDDIIENYQRSYLVTKILSLLAMLPFIILSSKLATFTPSGDLSGLEVVGLNLACLVLFLLVVGFSRFISDFKLSPVTSGNSYLLISAKILIIVALLALLMAAFSGTNVKYLVAAFICISSAIVFRLFFFSVEKDEKVKLLVEQMLSDENRRHSKHFYLFFIALLTGLTIFYYIAPSLEATNSLYILMIVFSFLFTYLDFWRHIYSNKTNFWKCVAFVATILFLILPFIPHKNQFRISFINSRPADYVKDSLGTALKLRIQHINQQDSTGSIYIICAMGGGSRAGYITAGTLRQLDWLSPCLWDQTLCYSTVSGGSVGLYHYLKSRDLKLLPYDTTFLDDIYRRNYNSSGVYGLLLGDAIETLFGIIATGPKSLISGGMPPNKYFDRNYRIRQEYDIVLSGTIKKEDPGYWAETFYTAVPGNELVRDTFRHYFQQNIGACPIHLINTFEVNSGRRAVLSPFPADTLFFTNTVLPLQDRAFDCNIEKKDIVYRDAVNLSELFPLISAASFLGSHENAQFVDGGYYENYGLATALDVYYNVNKIDSNAAKRIKILLIKNSQQDARIASHSVQYLAPLSGALNSPFTGHANNLLAESRRVLDSTNLYVITFNADSMKVPLTRTLTRRHISAMNTFIGALGSDTNLTKFIPRR